MVWKLPCSIWTKGRKVLPRASSSSSRDNFPCLMLQEGVMQTRRDVGWVGGLQHGSIFNKKKVVSVAWCKHRRLTCALTERDKLERKSKKSMSTWQERRGQGWARFSAGMPELELCFEFNATLPWECCPDHIFVSRTWTAGAILIKTKYKRGSCHFPSPE